jgi:hypothetical protein
MLMLMLMAKIERFRRWDLLMAIDHDSIVVMGVPARVASYAGVRALRVAEEP